VAGVQESFNKLILRNEPDLEVGGVGSEAVIGAVRAKDGHSVAVRLIVSRGKDLAHLVQMVIRDPGICEEPAADARAIVDSIIYTR